MNKLSLSLLVVVVVIVLASGASFLRQQSKPVVNDSVDNDQPSTLVANPAAEFCINVGGNLVEVESNDGVSANCVFPSGEECEEWSLFRGECEVTGVQAPGEFMATETYSGMSTDGEKIVFVHQDYTRYTLQVGDAKSTGMLNTERGWQEDNDATVFVLNWQAPDTDQIVFVKKTGSTALTQLNTDRAEITPIVTLELSI